MKYTGARILIETLIKNNVDTVFGYPGAAVLHIYDELFKYRNKIRHILVSHEQHASHAADGYARSTGRAGVCIATSGPGATNLVTGIATAFVDSVPVIAITGNVGIPLLGKDSFQEVDIAGITMPIVKHNWIIEDVRDIEEIVNEAFFVALSGRPGPVLVDIPRDISSAEIEIKGAESKIGNGRVERLINKTKRETFNDADIDRAVSLIKDSKRPMIYAGGGVIRSGARNEVKKLAELLGSPAAMSLMGMGAVPHDHNFCAGLIGMYGTAASNGAAQKTDLLIALGARFSDRVTNGSKGIAQKAKKIHIDIDPAEINKNIEVDAFIVGDLKKILPALIKKIPSDFLSEWNDDFNRRETARTNENKESALHPRFVIQETAKILNDDAVVVTDVGQHQIWTAQFYPFKNEGIFLTSGGLGTMGYGMGAAAGAKAANPQKPVVLFTGDGCFRMNCAEMAALVKYKLPVLIIIFNNSALGMLRQWQKISYKSRYYETDLDNSCPDFIKLAEAYNISGFRVTDKKSFTAALEKCAKLLAARKPALIEAVIDKNECVGMVNYN